MPADPSSSIPPGLTVLGHADRLRSAETPHLLAYLFIKTSSFSADARIYAERVNGRIVLIDAPELTQLMVEHNCGVRVEETFVLKEVDEDFFDES